MSPEHVPPAVSFQIRHLQHGVIAYQMLTGQRHSPETQPALYESTSSHAALSAQTEQKVRERVADVVHVCTRQDPPDRPQSAAASRARCALKRRGGSLYRRAFSLYKRTLSQVLQTIGDCSHPVIILTSL